MRTTVDLQDLNVWLALACPGHSHHHQALHYWEQQALNRCCSARLPRSGLCGSFASLRG
jgi:hypothetical protein